MRTARLLLLLSCCTSRPIQTLSLDFTPFWAALSQPLPLLEELVLAPLASAVLTPSSRFHLRLRDKFAAHLVQPRKNDTGTGVLLFSDILGHADNDTRDLAYRLSCHGYSVLVPDLFRGDPWDKSRSKDEQEGWRAQHTSKRVAADIDTSSAYLRDDVLQGGKMGLLGFCFGGGRAVETLARDDSRTFSAGAIFYGTRFDTMLGSQIRAPLLLITGDNDDLSPVNEVQKLATLVPGSQVQVYKGRGHAFAHHPGSVEEDEDAEDAFEAMRHWFHTHLLT